MCFCQTSIFHYDIKFLTLIAAEKAWSVRLPHPAKAQTALQETSLLTYRFLSNSHGNNRNANTATNFVPHPFSTNMCLPGAEWQGQLWMDSTCSPLQSSAFFPITQS